MTPLPKPGTPVRGSTTGRPLMAALDLLGRRWVLRVLWELRLGRLTFRALQDACGGPSPSVLNARLKALREGKLILHEDGEGYGLTAKGEELIAALTPLHQWSESWAKTLIE